MRGRARMGGARRCLRAVLAVQPPTLDAHAHASKLGGSVKAAKECGRLAFLQRRAFSAPLAEQRSCCPTPPVQPCPEQGDMPAVFLESGARAGTLLRRAPSSAQRTALCPACGALQKMRAQKCSA
jgi:hypothetical protein